MCADDPVPKSGAALPEVLLHPADCTLGPSVIRRPILGLTLHLTKTLRLR